MKDLKPITLKEKTTFILGAGASNPYGFPLGSELKIRMIENLENSSFLNFLTTLGFSKPLIDGFVEALPRTYHPTIDIFLENKTNFREIGAYVIAYTLLLFEKNALLFPQKDWYGHIYNALNFENEIPNADNVIFLSLNYERSLEHFLTKNIEYNCAHKLSKFAYSKLSKIRIIHAHGSLGEYPRTQFGADRQNEKILRRAAEGIRIVSDHLEDSPEFQLARKAIESAFNLVFIGFGYDLTTLMLLIHNIDLYQKRILGTTFGIDTKKISDIDKLFQGNFESGGGRNAELFLKVILP